MGKRVRSFTLDFMKSTSPQTDAARLWLAFCQAAGLSQPTLDLLSWAEKGPERIGRWLPDIEGDPPVEIVTTNRSRKNVEDVTREVRVRSPRVPLMFRAVLRQRGEMPTLRHPHVVPPLWTLVSASVDFGPAGSLDRAWAVLELFADWEPEVASGWEMDEIVDALSEVPELLVAFVTDSETGPSLSHAERSLLDCLLAPVRNELLNEE
jgi:hypothetical protein